MHKEECTELFLRGLHTILRLDLLQAEGFLSGTRGENVVFCKPRGGQGAMRVLSHNRGRVAACPEGVMIEWKDSWRNWVFVICFVGEGGIFCVKRAEKRG